MSLIALFLHSISSGITDIDKIDKRYNLDDIGVYKKKMHKMCQKREHVHVLQIYIGTILHTKKQIEYNDIYTYI